jgi:type VI secretion system (T6SS) effector TldE1-like protein
MPWTYSQSAGTLTREGATIAIGYSGHGDGKNNPAMQQIPNVGPIPQGRYSIGDPRDSEKVGPYALPLTPSDGTDTFGRSAFMIHGDSIVHPGTASEGCIILLRDARHQVGESDDRVLVVTA